MIGANDTHSSVASFVIRNPTDETSFSSMVRSSRSPFRYRRAVIQQDSPRDRASYADVILIFVAAAGEYVWIWDNWNSKVRRSVRLVRLLWCRLAGFRLGSAQSEVGLWARALEMAFFPYALVGRLKSVWW